MSFIKRYPLGLKELLNNIRITLQQTLLPSGAIVWFNLSNPPSGWVICDGSNGTPNLIGRYPLGATSNIGSTVEAGLPNITGAINMNGIKYSGSASGVFVATNAGGSGGCHELGTKRASISFDASRSSDVYGNSTTVTPPSIKLLPCMKL